MSNDKSPKDPWKYIDGQGIWKRYKHRITGEETIKEHSLREVKRWCGRHKFDMKIPSNRKIECMKCGQEVIFVVGYHTFDDDGHLISIKQ